MLRPTRSFVAIGLTVLVAGLGCSRGRLPDRNAVSLEQALHGHWSSTREFELAQAGEPWNTAGATERWGVEIDRYIDARAEPMAWSEMTGERHWRTQSQDHSAGMIEVAVWPAGQPENTSTVQFRFDADRTTLLEQVPAEGRRPRVREWTYVNDQASP